jgi:hypothetical protein
MTMRMVTLQMCYCRCFILLEAMMVFDHTDLGCTVFVGEVQEEQS